MKKKHFLKMMILLILCMSIIPMNLTEMNAAALSKKDFVPKSQNEKISGINHECKLQISVFRISTGAGSSRQPVFRIFSPSPDKRIF